jgi:hypothetical protein
VDFGGLFVLALVWAFFKLVSRSRDESASPRPPERPGLGPLRDPPQEEGRALRMLLKELERQVGQRAPPAAAARAATLEGPTLEGDRVEVDQDDQAEQVIARRAAATAARATERGQAVRQNADPRIRQQPADRTSARSLTPQQLRDAVVWREILGPPIAERDR